MAAGGNLFGLSADAKARLLQKLASVASARGSAAPARTSIANAGAERLDVSQLEAYREIRLIEEAAEYLGIGDPFFRVHEGIAGAETLLTTMSGLTAIRASPMPRRRRSTATAPRSRRAARFPASGRSIVNWNARWRGFTVPRTASRWLAVMRRT